MAVFTTVTVPDAQTLSTRLGLGEVTALQGIAGGIENTNYFLSTTQGDWVLTLFERLNHAQLPFYLELMRHLAHHGVVVPDPQPDADGALVHSLCGKPAAVVTRLQGRSELAPQVAHCQQLGLQLAHMHLASRGFALHQPNLRGLSWWAPTVAEVTPLLQAAGENDMAALLADELAWLSQMYASSDAAALPQGAVHCDLFRDNAMFVQASDGPRLSGFFDFYFAGVDALMFDLAVCINDWCIDLATGELDGERLDALVSHYQMVRPLDAVELRLLPALLRAAAFRFWLSRLWDWHLPREASVLKPHDPRHFERIVRLRRAQMDAVAERLAAAVAQEA
ncbi:homoserine kinase [Amphibiibacter pelophylacis]|uniref:Homoserine kinase n=1 Tax=Amphibiibacter pelophylacis TaxID=1799477 RepID=A0ACC6P0D1_9BURK